MEYQKKILLKDGRECILRNATENDAAAVLANFNLTHEQTDFLLSYPDEHTITVENEAELMKTKKESPNEIELLAEVDGAVAGLAGVDALGKQVKIRHRATFGISIDRAYWGLGIGKAMTEACIEIARKAGYEQLELNVVAENTKALSMYKKLGFSEFGRNPRGFKSRYSGYQEDIYMMLIL